MLNKNDRGKRVRTGGLNEFFRKYSLAILAHMVFGSAAVYFAFLFFEIELSFAFVRNLGVAVTLWASLGVAFNFAVTHAPKVEPWFSGLNVTVLGTIVLLCLVAMANHSNLVIHAIVIHLVLTLSMVWDLIARGYYKTRSRSWHKWFDELFSEDAKMWIVYLFGAYLPFYLPLILGNFHHIESHSEKSFTYSFAPSVVEAASDGVTAFVLFLEFFSFWWNLRKQTNVIAEHYARLASEDEPLSSENVLDRIRSTKTVRVGCFYWPPVVDCELAQSASGDGTRTYKAAGLYGKWLNNVAVNNNLNVICVPTSWHDMKEQLRTGAVDLLLCAFNTEERREYADFSKAFHQCAMQGVAQNSSRVWDIDSVRGVDVNIVIAKNEVGFEFAKSTLELDPNYPSTRFTVVQTSRIEEVASIVLGGTADYVGIADALSIHRIQGRHSGTLRIVLDAPPLKTYDVAVMFLKGQSTLQKWIDAEFDRVRNDAKMVTAEKDLMAELGPLGFFRKI